MKKKTSSQTQTQIEEEDPIEETEEDIEETQEEMLERQWRERNRRMKELKFNKKTFD